MNQPIGPDAEQTILVSLSQVAPTSLKQLQGTSLSQIFSSLGQQTLLTLTFSISEPPHICSGPFGRNNIFYNYAHAEKPVWSRLEGRGTEEKVRDSRAG